MRPGGFRQGPIVKYVFGLKGCGQVKFLLDHFGNRLGRPNGQRFAKETVQ
jgi:hypothetical protein